MFQNNRPRYWVAWYDRWHLWLALLLILLLCMALYLGMTTAVPKVTLNLADANARLQTDQPIMVSGTAPADSIVRIYEGDKLLGETRADGNGNYALAITNVAAGAHALRASIESNGTRIESDALAVNVNAAVAAAQPTTAPTATSVPPTATRVPATPTPLPPTATVIPPSATPLPPTATPAAPSAPPTLGAALGAVQPRSKDNAEMVYVPAGEFAMGGDPAPAANQAANSIYLNAFWMDKFEVTNEQFQQFAGATGYQTDAEKQGWGYEFVNARWEQTRGITWRAPRGSAGDMADKMKYPVVLVSWNDANAYCAWAGERLPTEAEWEKSARGTDARAFPWGNTWDGTKLNFCDVNCGFAWKDSSVNDRYAESAPVGSLPQGASVYGIQDLAGNVWEWTADWFGADYYKTMPTRNPTGPASGQFKILRGGAWSIDSSYARTTAGFPAVPEYRERSVGFRCVQ
jgi:formylglycine-generating enzyme required for sulfatase activity